MQLIFFPFNVASTTSLILYKEKTPILFRLLKYVGWALTMHPAITTFLLGSVQPTQDLVKSLKINEEFEIFCSINNTDVLDETIIYNIDLEVILPDGVENTTKRTKTNINLFAKNSENITVFAKSTAVGPKNILCRATSDNGGNNQTSKTMNIKNKEIFRDESSSSGSSGRGNGGTNFFPAIPPQTCKNYTYKCIIFHSIRLKIIHQSEDTNLNKEKHKKIYSTTPQKHSTTLHLFQENKS